MSRVFSNGETIKDANGDDCEVLQTATHFSGSRTVIVYRAPGGSVLFMNEQKAQRLNPAP